MDVTMRTMQSTSVMVNRKLTYKPKDNPNFNNIRHCEPYLLLIVIYRDIVTLATVEAPT